MSTRQAVVRRTHWLRLFALLITLLGLAAQQRVLTPALRPSAPVARLVAEREQNIETQALRAELAVRLAAAPGFARVPYFPQQPIVSWLPVYVRACPALPSVLHTRASLSHFHSKRRIPRMNSEEPPRA